MDRKNKRRRSFRRRTSGKTITSRNWYTLTEIDADQLTMYCPRTELWRSKLKFYAITSNTDGCTYAQRKSSSDYGRCWRMIITLRNTVRRVGTVSTFNARRLWVMQQMNDWWWWWWWCNHDVTSRRKYHWYDSTVTTLYRDDVVSTRRFATSLSSATRHVLHRRCQRFQTRPRIYL